MKRLTKALGLIPAEWLLGIAAGSLLLTVRLGLWVLPLDTVRRVLSATAPTSRGGRVADATRTGQVGRAVGRMSTYVPAATCLTQALAADWLLKWLGQPSELRIGATKDAKGDFHAHSWLESGGRIVIGGLPDLHSYKVLTRRKDGSG
jgi:hypothetical protein